MSGLAPVDPAGGKPLASRGDPAPLAALFVAAPVLLCFSPALLDSFTPLKTALFLACSAAPLALLAARVARLARPVPLSGVDLSLALFFLCALLTVPFAGNPALSARSALLLPPAAAFYAACRMATPAGRRRILDGFLILSVPVALYALAQAARLDPFFAPPDFFSISRAFSTLGNRNYVAYLLGAAALLALARVARRGAQGRAAASALGLFAGTLAVLSTRGALLALAAGAVPLLLSPALPGRVRRLVPAAVAAFALYLAFAGAGLAPQLTQRLKELPGDENVAMRLEIWSMGLAAFADRPLFGHGFGGFSDAFLAAKERALLVGTAPPRFLIHATRAHNGFVQVAAELGAAGLLLLCALLLFAWRGLPRPGDRALLVYFLVGTLYDFPAETSAGGLLFLALLARSGGRPAASPRLGPLERGVLAAALLLLPLPLLAVAGFELSAARDARLAERAFARGDLAAAEAHLAASAGRAFLTDRSRFRLAGLLLDRERPEEALDLLEGMVERRLDPATLHNRGLALLRLGRFAEAEPLFARVLPLSAAPHAALMNLGVCAERSGRPERAADLYRESLRARPTKEALLNLLGLARLLPVEAETLDLARSTGLIGDPATRAALAERFRDFGDFARAAEAEAAGGGRAR